MGGDHRRFAYQRGSNDIPDQHTSGLIFKTHYTNDDIEAYQLESKILGGLYEPERLIITHSYKMMDLRKPNCKGLKNLSYDLLMETIMRQTEKPI